MIYFRIWVYRSSFCWQNEIKTRQVARVHELKSPIRKMTVLKLPIKEAYLKTSKQNTSHPLTFL